MVQNYKGWLPKGSRPFAISNPDGSPGNEKYHRPIDCSEFEKGLIFCTFAARANRCGQIIKKENGILIPAFYSFPPL